MSHLSASLRKITQRRNILCHCIPFPPIRSKRGERLQINGRNLLVVEAAAMRSPGEAVVFGFQGGETVSRKKDYRKDAQQRWRFLTYYDLSTIKNEAQLRAMVKGRSGITEAQAKSEVDAWMKDKHF
jgi:hypothetical protein